CEGNSVVLSAGGGNTYYWIGANIDNPNQSSINATPLSSGIYRVEARAFANNLVLSEPLLIQFRVAKAPFPWTTLLLSTLLSLALSALWWGYRQNSKLSTINIELADTNRQLAETRLQLANETENERRRISRDLHDQTLADLRRLILMSDQLSSGIGIDPKSFRQEIESVSTEIRKICEDLSPSVLTNVGLTAALQWALSEAVSHLPDEKRFEYEFLCDDMIEDQIELDAGTQIQIYRIFQEAISNVCRHAEAKFASLHIEIEKESSLVITLEDNGRGVAKANKTGRGLSNIRSRASMIDATVEWLPRESGGTLFRLKKPFLTN
ncbi:MAG: hypothetical protein JNN15_19390, partial [Blastocatellia bacterium]|nr:hypothetical protein [Blastocatellia bacterium]